jgi:hypothetical protein
VERDMRGQRTGTGRIIKLHRNFLPLEYWLSEEGD